MKKKKENNPKFYFMFNVLIFIEIIFFLFFHFNYLSQHLIIMQ